MISKAEREERRKKQIYSISYYLETTCIYILKYKENEKV